MFFGGRVTRRTEVLPGALLSTPTVIWLSKYMSLMKAVTCHISRDAGRPISAGFQGVRWIAELVTAFVGLNGFDLKPGVVGPCAIARRFMIALNVASDVLPRMVCS